MSEKYDVTLKYLLDLDGVSYVIDEHLGLWVKFDAKQVTLTHERPHGVRYSLTLHNRSNTRIMGFDNAHAIELGKKKNIVPLRKHDHWHRTNLDKGRPYNYEDAGKLIEDFWKEVDRIHKKLLEDK